MRRAWWIVIAIAAVSCGEAEVVVPCGDTTCPSSEYACAYSVGGACAATPACVLRAHDEGLGCLREVRCGCDGSLVHGECALPAGYTPKPTRGAPFRQGRALVCEP